MIGFPPWWLSLAVASIGITVDVLAGHSALQSSISRVCHHSSSPSYGKGAVHIDRITLVYFSFIQK